MSEPADLDDVAVPTRIHWTIVNSRYITGVPPGQPLNKPVYKLQDYGSDGWHYTRPNMAIGLFQLRDLNGYAQSEDAAKAACADDVALLDRYQGWLEFMANNPPPK